MNTKIPNSRSDTRLATLAEGAFAMLRPELDVLPGAPRTAAEFFDRITKPGSAENMVSPAEAARRLGVHKLTVLKAIKDGRIEAVKTSQRMFRIPEHCLSAIASAVPARRQAQIQSHPQPQPARIRK